MINIDLSRFWSPLLAPAFGEVWFEARKEILMASRMEMDDNVWMTSPPDHMGDPAQKVDQSIHQFAEVKLREKVPSIQVLGEETALSSLLLRTKDYRYIAYLDAVDGSAQAWSLPGAWGHVAVIQEFVGSGGNEPRVELRFIGVLDAEGGITMAEEGADFVAIDLVDRGFDHDACGADEISYSGEIFEVTKRPVILVGGYKPSWWERFTALRLRVCERWPDKKEEPGPAVFNTAGSPVTRKVIQNADNVVVQLGASTLWDGATAALVSRAGGYVIRVGETEFVPPEEVWGWWSSFGYQRKTSDGKQWEPAKLVPPFVAGMEANRVQAVAELCLDLPTSSSASPCRKQTS